MMSDTEYTYAQVSEHKSKKDLYVVIHDVVYDTTNFVDEHPGGEEVLLDVGGIDATEAFEDVGHSDEARDILKDMKIGVLKRMPGDPAPPKAAAPSTTTASSADGAGLGVGLYAVVFVGAIIAVGAYKYLQAQSQDTK